MSETPSDSRSSKTSPRALREAERRVSQALKTSSNKLSLNSLSLAEVPSSVANLSNLRHLSLSDNRLTSIPTFVFQLRNLARLDLSRNRISELPEDVSTLSSLFVLDVSNNALKSLPHSLLKLSRLKILDVRDNLDLGIPPEISNDPQNRWRSAKPAEVLSFYFRLGEAAQTLNEAKILLVGQGGVGKTSLVNRLLHNLYDPDEQKTEGISIHGWEIPSSDRGEGRPIQLNIWDFGGQEIMHATHQFFLTKRSLYLLVLDARKGENESNIQYWLKIIQSYGGDSPVLVVINKCDENNLELNETRLRKDYAPSIVGFYKTSCLHGSGIDQLRNALQQQIHNLPHVYDLLPKSYFFIKSELEKLARRRDFIDITEYENICRRFRVSTPNEITRLLRFLHDLGSVLNFDDPNAPFELRDTNILNPEWVTGGVYKILNSNILMQAGGILDFADLHRILGSGPTYPRERHKFILEIMRKFELCFDFPDTEGRRLLIPELLSPNEPDLEWQYDESLNFEYHYRVLPQGLICRFIVRMHASLTDRPTYWRSGVILDIDGNRCLVRADTDAGRIYISIKGPSDARRRALSVIRTTFKAIHDSIPRIEAAEKVPLPDNPTVVVDYNHLTKLEGHGTGEFLPEGADRTYTVGALLEGIEVRSPKKKISVKRINENDHADHKVTRVIVLLVAFTVVIVSMMSALAVISIYLGASTFIAVTVTAILFSVLIMTMIGMVTKMFGEKTAARLFELVLKNLPRISSAAPGRKRGETSPNQSVRKRVTSISRPPRSKAASRTNPD
jgi:internalin A